MSLLLGVRLIILILSADLLFAWKNGRRLESKVSVRDILTEFYDALGGANWTSSENWMSAQSVSEWHGVVTDASGNVTGLYLANNNLIGRLPTSFGLLGNLTEIDLHGNSISGTLPDLKNLTRLATLDVGANALGGSFPTTILGCSQLVRLDLCCNKFKGQIPSSVGELQSLKSLSLQANSLSGSVPTSIGSLTGLEELYVGNNSFAGNLAVDFSGLTVLKRVSFAWNQIIGTLPSSITSCLELVEIDFSNNAFSGSLPSQLSTLVQLERISVGTNKFTGFLPMRIGAMSRLVTVEMSDNQFSALLPTSLASLKHIETLDLSSNSLEGTIPAAWWRVSSLRTLRLGDNSFYGSLPTFIFSLGNLTELSISVSLLQSSIPSTIGLMTNLKRLTLSGSSITGTIPSEIALLQQLEELDFSANLMIGSVTTTTQCKSLQKLQLNNNTFEGTFPAEVLQLSNLTSLSIRHNKFTGQLPVDLRNLSKMEYFDVGYNSFDGKISSSLSTFTALTHFSCSTNEFYGEILGNLCQSKGLQVLDVSSNSFIGSIPDSCKDLKKLTVLNLASNHFNGSIPTELGSFDDLVEIKLRDNSFVGSIPTELSRLSVLQALSVSNNEFTGSISPSLCDPPLLKYVEISNLGLCFPDCLARPMDFTYSGAVNVTRCLSEQDQVICSLSSNVRKYLGISKSTESVDTPVAVIESLHPFVSSNKVTRTIVIDGATEYYFKTDEWTDICEEVEGRITIVPKASIVTAAYESTCFGTTVVKSTTGIQFSFELLGTVTSTDLWGYKFTVMAKVKPVEKHWECETAPAAALRGTSLSLPAASAGSSSLARMATAYSTNYATTMCEWDGVTCTSGIITELDLSSKGIEGKIPSYIGELTGLKKLLLSFNSFTGTIPESFGNLTNLEVLTLNNNALTGRFPAALGSLSKAKTVSVASNALSQRLYSDVCSLNSTLDISGNNIDCYESCWYERANSGQLVVGSITPCAPTSMPTAQPTGPPPKEFDPLLYIPISFGGMIFLVLIGYGTYYVATAKQRKRAEVLSHLPIHLAIKNQKSSAEELISIIELNKNAIFSKDFDGNDAVEYACRKKCDLAVIQHLVELCLPVDKSSGEDISPESHGYVWIHLVQNDENLAAVEAILAKYPMLSTPLAITADESGRSAVNVASSECGRAIRESTYLFRRYEVLTENNPYHQSNSSTVHLAKDHRDNGNDVAMKFFCDKFQFDRELQIRNSGGFDNQFVVEVLRVHDATNDAAIAQDAEYKGYSNFPYVMVMYAGDRNLEFIIMSEKVAASDWTSLRSMTTQLLEVLEHLGDCGIVHADIKPMNILRQGNRLKLIDLDASCVMGDFVGYKCSSAYAPPEMVVVENNGDVRLRSFEMDHETFAPKEDGSRSYSLLVADTSFDIWSVGMVLYEIYAGSKFFLSDCSNNMSKDMLKKLREWNLEFVVNRFNRIHDILARNLASLLLHPDPSKRGNPALLRSHPFLTGKPQTYPPQEFDVFICYRHDCDEEVASRLCEILQAAGLAVWRPDGNYRGYPRDSEASMGMASSRILIPLFTRPAVTHESDDSRNFTKLEADSPNDSFLVDLLLGVELYHRGMIEKVYPVLLGDVDSSVKNFISRRDYFATGCHPALPPEERGVTVRSSVLSLHQELFHLGLGTPLMENFSVSHTINVIMKNQGKVAVGEESEAFHAVTSDTMKMLDGNYSPKSRLHTKRPASELFSDDILANAAVDLLHAKD